MAKMKKRDDGLYQKQVIVGRNPDGTYIRKSVYAKTKKELDIKAAEILQQVHAGSYVLDSKETFEKLAELWLEKCNPLQSEKWTYREKGFINNHLLPVLGNMKVQEMKTYHLQMLINQKAKDGYATHTMKMMKQTAARILDVAVDAELVQRNVFQSVKVPSLPPKERQALSLEQIKMINETWETHRMGYPAMIMLYCGLRRGELMALKWQDVNLAMDYIDVNKAVEVMPGRSTIKAPKSKAGIRKVPIPKALHDVLAEVKRNDDDLVCPSAHGKLMTSEQFQRAWKSYMNHLNLYYGGKNASRTNPKVQVIEKFTPHMLRHTYATLLYDAGVDIKSAQKFLGHADVEMTLAVYTHLTPFKMDAAVSVLNSHLDNSVSIDISHEFDDVDD